MGAFYLGKSVCQSAAAESISSAGHCLVMARCYFIFARIFALDSTTTVGALYVGR